MAIQTDLVVDERFIERAREKIRKALDEAMERRVFEPLTPEQVKLLAPSFVTDIRVEGDTLHCIVQVPLQSIKIDVLDPEEP